MSKPVCAISKNQNIRQAVFDALSQIDLPDLNGKKILLKPNVGRNVKKHLGINTSPTVVNAVYDFLRARFDATFFLGDSPILGVKTKEAFISSGYGFLMNERNLNFIDLDSIKPAVIPIENGRILKTIKLTGFIHDFDYIVSIPVLKMHMHTGASLSFKNMKGLIYKREKVKLHQLLATEQIKRGNKELDIAIADLANAIEPDLAVIDAYYAQEGMGPSAGHRKKLNTIIASTDYLAADIVALAIVKLDIEHAPHLKLISEQTSGVHSIKDITTIPSDIEPFKSDFKVPPNEIRIENKKITLFDMGSCSACQSSVFLFVKNNESLLQNYFNEYGQLNIALGKNIQDVPNDSILIGNCTIHQKQKGTFIKGCPPTQTIIKETLEREVSKSSKN
jgi:uncharacterized protein (DUF362 family)